MLSTFTMDTLYPSKSQIQLDASNFGPPLTCQSNFHFRQKSCLWYSPHTPHTFFRICSSVVSSPFSAMVNQVPGPWPQGQSDSCASPGVHGHDPGVGVPLQVSTGLPRGRGLVGSVWITVFVHGYYVFSALREQFLRY